MRDLLLKRPITLYVCFFPQKVIIFYENGKKKCWQQYGHFLFQMCDWYDLINFLGTFYICMSNIVDFENLFYISDMFEYWEFEF